MSFLLISNSISDLVFSFIINILILVFSSPNFNTKIRIFIMKENTKSEIELEISKNDIVLFMKGTPVFPQCGFSAATVGILNHLGVKFSSINVLEDEDIRQGIKEHANWPTIPQLYVKGEFVGGCDIVREMYESGELTDLISTKGIKTTKSN
jgi:monothiol glutaredoxin